MAKGLPAYGLPSPVKPAAGPGAALVDAASSRLRAVYAAHKVPVILLYYGLCSSTLIVINKLAVHSVQAPVFILMTQLLVAAGAVLGAKAAGWVDAEPLRWQLVRPFTLIILGFLGTLYANIQVLAYSNVETFITFRSSTPLVLSIADYLFLGRELPGGRSILSLVLLVASCAGYTAYDAGFRLQAYSWLLVWYVFFTFEACYVKHMCDTVAMTNWGRVYYTNLLAGGMLALIFPFCRGEHALLLQHGLSHGQLATLALSCAVGVGMSHAGYLMRSNVSATAGVVVGVVCKIGSVLINLVMWDQHASPMQLCFLALGLAGGSLFRQAPLRAAAAAGGAAAGGMRSASPAPGATEGSASRGSSSNGGSDGEAECLIKVFDGHASPGKLGGSGGGDAEPPVARASSASGGLAAKLRTLW